MLPKRDTRVQLFIIENGRYIMLEHHIIQKGLFVWGLPGGGMEPGESHEETAIREAFEETGLRIRLMPGKFERNFKDSPVYKRAVTFVAVPEDGDAALGEEPEEEMKQLYELTGIRWQDLGDRNLSQLEIENTEPILDWLSSPAVAKTMNHVVSNPDRGLILENGSGGVFFDGSEEIFKSIVANANKKTKLDGNLIEDDGFCRLETTFIHEVKHASLEVLEECRWVPLSDAAGMLENLGVARHLKKTMRVMNI